MKTPMNKQETYNILIDTPPYKFGGVYFKTGYQVVLNIFRLLDNKTMDDSERAKEILFLLFDEMPKYDQEEMWKFLVWYITLGEDKKEDSEKRIFDWGLDSGRVYAAFLQVYSIDLLKEKMHWWVFKTLFDGLPSETKMQDVINIRTQEIDIKSSPKERMRLVKLKSLFNIENDDKDQFPI